MTATSFQHLAPPARFFVGENSLVSLGRELDRLGSKRAAVVCGSSLSRDAGAMGLVRDAIGTRLAGVIANVKAHSPVPAVIETSHELAAMNADAVIAVGGGSAMVTARAASIFAAEGTNPDRLCSVRGTDGRWTSPRLDKLKLPQLVIPTTPTTACMKAGSAVFEPETGARLALFDPKTRAQSVFVHPALVSTAPQQLVLSATMNTLCMAVEGLESNQANQISDGYLMQALRLVSSRLPLEGRDDVQARCDLVLAAILVGLGTEQSAGGVASVLGYAIGARHRTDNGLVNAIMLPHTMRFNAPATQGRAGKIAVALGVAGSGKPGIDQAVAAVEELIQPLPLARRLRDAGILESDLAGIAQAAIGEWFLQKNPRRVEGPEDLDALLRAAW